MRGQEATLLPCCRFPPPMPERPPSTVESEPDWNDVRQEAERLAREVLLDTFSITRRAWRMANRVGDRLASTAEAMGQKVEARVSRRRAVRRR